LIFDRSRDDALGRLVRLLSAAVSVTERLTVFHRLHSASHMTGAMDAQLPPRGEPFDLKFDELFGHATVSREIRSDGMSDMQMTGIVSSLTEFNSTWICNRQVPPGGPKCVVCDPLDEPLTIRVGWPTKVDGRVDVVPMNEWP